MDEDSSSEILPLNTEDLQTLKTDLLATVFNQANIQLLIYQRGKCLRSNLEIKTRKTSLIGIGDELMPSEDILNDIKLDKELDGLRHIYETACNLVSNKIETNKDDSQELEEDPYEIIKDLIESRKPCNSKMDVLTRELKENKQTVKRLKEQLKEEKSKKEQMLLERGENLKTAKEQLYNAKRINVLEFRLVQKWEANRLSQAKILGEIEERSLMKQIVDYNRRMAGEHRLICEVESFRKNQIAELGQQICDLEVKFKEKKADLLAKNLQLLEDMADLEKAFEKHSEINETRKEFVAEYKKIKAEEKRLYEEQMYRVECAVRIQAWWRGTMVRRGLGPYRKKSKKGKKGKGKK